MEPSRGWRPRQETVSTPRAVLMASILSFTLSRKAGDFLQAIVGLFLQGHGTKKSVINVLHGFGVCVSPTKIKDLFRDLNTAGKGSLVFSLFSISKLSVANDDKDPPPRDG